MTRYTPEKLTAWESFVNGNESSVNFNYYDTFKAEISFTVPAGYSSLVKWKVNGEDASRPILDLLDSSLLLLGPVRLDSRKYGSLSLGVEVYVLRDDPPQISVPVVSRTLNLTTSCESHPVALDLKDRR